MMPGTVATIKYIEKTELEGLKSFRIVDSVSRELEGVLRRFIDYHLEVSFKSLEFLRKLRVAHV